MSKLTQIISEAESQEVFQEALLKVFLLAKQDPSNLSFATKLERLEPLFFTIAKNLAITKTRHKQVRDKYLQEQTLYLNGTTLESLETKVAKEKEQELLTNAIETLPPICKKVFIERKIQGTSHTEIASKFGISKKTVENHITKGLKLCREFIQRKHKTAIPETTEVSVKKSA